MDRKIKRLTAFILLVMMTFAAVPAQRLVSYAAEGKITFSDPSVTVGNTVSVTMKITSTSGEGLGASDVMLNYDASKLEFVSGTGANGGAGSVRVLGSMEAEGQTSFSFTLKFKALAAGTATVSVASQEVYDANSQAVSVSHVGNSSVKVKAPVTYSKEAALSSLEISPGSLSPAFSSDVTSYTAAVSGDIAKLSVSALAKDSKAKVDISGNENLVVGENTVVCKVTAEDGTTTKSYTVTVTKTEGTVSGEGDGDGSTQASANAQASGMNVTVNEKSYQVAGAFDAAALPAGFEQTSMEYSGEQIQVGRNTSLDMTLIYLTDSEGNGDFFLYNSDSGTFAPYVTVEMAEKAVVVLPIERLPEDMKLPDGFVECSIDIGSYTVRGWIWNTDVSAAPEYCVVYGVNENGEANLYRYDQKEMTLQRYFQDPAAEDIKTRYTNLAEEFNSLLDDYEIRGWIIAGLFVVCVILIIVIVVILLRKPKNTRYGDYGYGEPERPAVRKTAKRSSGRKERSWDEDHGGYDEPEDMELSLEALDDEFDAPPREVPEKPERRPRRQAPPASVEDMEKDIAAGLAREASGAADGKRKRTEDDDDLELIDLDL